MRILLVEDDRALREVTAHHLRGAGYEVEELGDGETALAAAQRERPIAVVLDIGLPGVSGIEVCRELRTRFEPSPGVVMVTARGSEADMVVGLDAGADDYVVKPFAPRVLLARLGALCRRITGGSGSGQTRAAAAKWGDIEVNAAARRVTAAGRELALTPTEFALIAILVSSPGRVHTRRELLSAVFGTQHEGYARNVDCHVTRLRRKLESVGLAPAPIYTVHGVGYRLGETTENLIR